MNRHNLTVLRDALRTPAVNPQFFFDMNYTSTGLEGREVDNLYGESDTPRKPAPHCNTAGCIAGLATYLFDRKNYPLGFTDTLTTARDDLGLDTDTARALFFPNPVDARDWNKITEAQAAETIDKLLETGSVDWSHVQ